MPSFSSWVYLKWLCFWCVTTFSCAKHTGDSWSDLEQHYLLSISDVVSIRCWYQLSLYIVVIRCRYSMYLSVVVILYLYPLSLSVVFILCRYPLSISFFVNRCPNPCCYSLSLSVVISCGYRLWLHPAVQMPTCLTAPSFHYSRLFIFLTLPPPSPLLPTNCISNHTSIYSLRHEHFFQTLCCRLIETVSVSQTISNIDDNTLTTNIRAN